MTMKGKRSKRQRSQSPFSFPMPSPISKKDDLGSDHVSIRELFDPNSSRGFEEGCTEEEQDTANCLILLAQGQLNTRASRKESVEKKDGSLDTEKFRSKIYVETASDGSGKAGYYLYECKTCKRKFPSFQALGGHRASHKKPKPTKLETTNNNNTVYGHFGNPSSPFVMHSLYKDRRTYDGNSRHNIISMSDYHKGNNKVHECGICGAEFNSGQALGGHMRRHRGLTDLNTVLSLNSTAVESNVQDSPIKARKVFSLGFDLNLPAPEIDNLNVKSHFAPKQNEQHQDHSRLSSPG